MPCILLHTVGAGGELKEVAEGTLIQPLTRDMHNVRMSEAVMRVRLTAVVPEFHYNDPPMQPPGADEHLVLGECPKWVLEWPKTQIRLGVVKRTTGATSKRRPPIVRPSTKPPRKLVVKESAPEAAVATTQKETPVVATTRKEPPVVVASNRHKQLLGTFEPQPSKDKAVAPQIGANDDDEDDDNVDVDGFINTGATQDMFMPDIHMDDEPFRAHRALPARPTTCTQRLNFQGLSQQDTPPEAGIQSQPANVFSPGTIFKSIKEGVQSPEMKKKQHRKRSRPGASASQPAPKTIWGHEDMVPPRADGLT